MNVRELKGGDVLRIALKAGHQIDPLPDGTMAAPPRPMRARGYSVSTFFAYLLTNQPDQGFMTVNLRHGPNWEVLSAAKIPYAGIASLQYVVPQGRPVVETAPKSHPGAQALGTKMAQLYQQPFLKRVEFCGC